MLPDWITIIIGVAALVTAAGVIWQKVIAPSFRLAKQADRLIPLLREFTEAFEDTPQVFLILNEIAAEFRTDSGSTLRDVVNKLDALVSELTVKFEAARQLSADDRKTLARVIVLLDLLEAKGDLATADRAGIAENLVTAQAKVEAVADALSASEHRADQVEGGEPGAAADAGAQSHRPEE